MKIISSFKPISDQPLALTIGNFDGVHKGHQHIIQSLKSKAKALGYRCAVMTFNPHAKVFFKSVEDFLIYDDDKKLKYIAECGVDDLYHIPFNQAFSEISPHEFIQQLVSKLNVAYLLVGDDFKFGHKGQGNFELLRQMSSQQNWTVEDTQTVVIANNRVSSSRIRYLIKQCDFDLAAKLLGRPYRYTGDVIKGKQLGRTIGFPTANLAIEKERLVPEGVFVVSVKINSTQQSYFGMCNIGINPTVDNQIERKLEVHLFDFQGDLYNKNITITPIKKIRDSQKFNGIDALKQQLSLDKAQSLNILATLD